MCTVYKVVLAELVRECDLSRPEELAGAAALFAQLVACFDEAVAGHAKKCNIKVGRWRRPGDGCRRHGLKLVR